MAVDEAYLRALEQKFDDCYSVTRNGIPADMLSLQLLASSVPLLVAALREARGIPEPAEPVPFPVDRSRR